MCIVRLQPYSMKVPSHNSFKACSGAVCYLPLSTMKTVETLDQVQSLSESLPVPEVSIMLHTAPTKRIVVYRSLVSVDKIKTALRWLTCNNRFYCGIDGSCIEDETVIQELDKATSDVLKKTNLSDLQSYTIRDMDIRQPITLMWKITKRTAFRSIRLIAGRSILMFCASLTYSPLGSLVNSTADKRILIPVSTSSLGC